MTFRITHAEIDLKRLRSETLSPSSGGYVLFEGWVRDHHEGQQVLRLEYEVYEPLAVKEGLKVIAEAEARFGPIHAVAEHRAGLLEIGEVAVAVAVASAHRDEAFRACRYIIDEAKARLPIWKKEYFADGRTDWVNCQRCAGHAHGGEGR